MYFFLNLKKIKNIHFLNLFVKNEKIKKKKKMQNKEEIKRILEFFWHCFSKFQCWHFYGPQDFFFCGRRMPFFSSAAAELAHRLQNLEKIWLKLCGRRICFFFLQQQNLLCGYSFIFWHKKFQQFLKDSLVNFDKTHR